MTEAEKKAKKKYLGKGKRMTIDFYPSEANLIEHVEKQPQKQTYIKNLIRRDMKAHGRWEFIKVPNTVDTCGNPVYHAHCSECGFVWTNLYAVKNYFDCCPKCGAKLDK